MLLIAWTVLFYASTRCAKRDACFLFVFVLITVEMEKHEVSP
jgi:hypothetical protein